MRKILTAVAGAALAGGIAVTGIAQTAQATPAASHGVLASYQGRTIDLSKGWQGAKACAVFAADDVRCYPTAAAADKASGYKVSTDALRRGAKADTTAIPACANGWVCLFKNKNGGGRRLIFNEGHWDNLDNYGFDNATSSWRNNQKKGDLAGLSQFAGGKGKVIHLSAPGYAAGLGSFDNRASAVAG
ncbi:peptidase inhibitor family I36 protein [Streptomyces sp. NPDC048644]|uniref:peptidase inhibitor family I36 protein n=1 Tax=Streptomyces sp. NPDC048644 TaxID=3365582 RepID=UPI0037222A39